MTRFARRMAMVPGLALLAAAALLHSAPVAGAPTVAQGRLHVAVSDRQTGQHIPARCYLADTAGHPWAPPGAMAYAKGAEQNFVTRGEFEVSLPSGAYTLTVERGPEYRPVSRIIEIHPGDSLSEGVALTRWIDMNARGWYSGDLHNHRDWRQMPGLLLSEDLNLAPTLTQWVWENGLTARAPRADGAPSVRVVDRTHAFSVFDTEIERLRQGPGAVDLLALREPLDFSGYLLAPPNDVYADAAHAQGGYVDAEKIVWRDTAALVALGKIDFAGVVYNHFHRRGVETATDEWGMIPKDRPEYATPAGMPLWSLDVYYKFLNCGFRLPASAGSASGVKPSPLGYERVYVRLGQRFDYQEWFRALKAGRSFATNGPLLFLEVNGRQPGDTLHISRGGRAHVVVDVEASTAGKLDRVEIIWKGRVVRSVRAAGNGAAVRARYEFEANGTGWVAARAFESPLDAARFAQTSPVYIQAGDEPGIVAGDVKFFLNWIDRETTFYQRCSEFRSEADRRAMLAMFAKARAVYERLAARAGSAP